MIIKFFATKNLNLWSSSLFSILSLLPVRVDTTSRKDTTDEFIRFDIIKPTLHLRGDRNDGKNISGSNLENGRLANELTLSYVHDEKDVIIDLKLSHNFIPQDHFIKYQLLNGTDDIQRIRKTDVDLCHYQGTIRNNTSSQVALSTCNGIKGVIFDGHEKYYIDTLHNGNLSREHLLYRKSDRIKNRTQHSTCGYNNEKESAKYGFRHKRSADNFIRGPYNAKLDSLFVELVLVVDKALYVKLDKNLSRIHSYCKDIVNIVNSAFVQINIFIALVGVVVWSERNEIKVSSNANTTLDNFLHYRFKNLNSNHPNDIAFLLTGTQFKDGILGQSFVNTICTYTMSGGIAYDKYGIAGTLAETVAHEMGHNFGMKHDTPDCHCESDHCIMAESNGNHISMQWSSCNIKQLSSTFQRGMTSCLKNKPSKLFDMDSPKCGNEFVEPGEECDCGLLEFCDNWCCDATTCMLVQNASCATGECCDLATCRLHTQGTVCRPTEGDCDISEYCTGDSEYCPENIFKRDTELCGDGKAYCYEGSCQSHDDQCKLLWGEAAVSIDQCYKKNLVDDVMCGVLQCQSPINSTLKIGNKFLVHESTDEIDVDGKTYICDQIFVGLQVVDPGLTPNGAICGQGKMCVDQKCLSIESLRSSGVGVDCPGNCSGHGICDNKRSCHCDNGYEAPMCITVSNDGLGVAVRQLHHMFVGVTVVVNLIFN